MLWPPTLTPRSRETITGMSPYGKRLGTLRLRREVVPGATYYVQNRRLTLPAPSVPTGLYVVRSTWYVFILPPPRSLRVRCTRRIRFRRDARWGRAGVTGTPRVATRRDLLPEAPPAALRRSTALPDPAPTLRRKFLARKGTSPTRSE